MTIFLTILTILSSFLANLETKTLQSDFVVTVRGSADTPMNYPGQLTMSGQCFRLTMLNIEAAFDGKTMYMYSGETDELTLTNPTQQELIETNPFLYAKTMSDLCTVTERTEGEQTVVTLTPEDQSAGIHRFVLKIRTRDLIPLQLEIKEAQKTSTLQMTNPAFISERPEYIIHPEKDTYINDMRL